MLGITLLNTRVEELCENLDHKITNAGIIISRVGAKPPIATIYGESANTV